MRVMKSIFIATLCSASCSVAFAAGNACPAVGDISQKIEGNIIKYSANANGSSWKGSANMDYGATDALLKSLVFTAARFMGSGKDAKVICQYEGGSGGGVSMVQRNAGHVTGDNWKVVNRTTWDCETKGSPQSCTFEMKP
ncbi:DUF3757 domain-containing protein [Pandoraea pulmonicola]|uniref:Protein of uncharacterized function (DUF3757) n=1 Tax=Pandoraea pulmonicola TaxID=93221 RepID=A0AAJ4ZF62_PANPU|nr:DUF3757 domain-containing protein [Pandoraea pulmonicola]SUA92263.1 Protein of uncharacterised function (DUF3757) [Pandoraea pulmonicola]